MSPRVDWVLSLLLGSAIAVNVPSTRHASLSEVALIDEYAANARHASRMEALRAEQETELY